MTRELAGDDALTLALSQGERGQATLAGVAWGAVAAGSLLLRLAVIDRVPLSEAEARVALPAWLAVGGQLDSSLVEGGTPLLSNILVALFWLFGASDADSRLPSALAGTALALTPALLTRPLGAPVALSSAVLIGTSPIAVQLSRVLDPAMLTAALAMASVACAFRLLTDRPSWYPWLLAVVTGLGLAHEPAVLLALAAAGVAALATWGTSGVRAWGLGIGDWGWPLGVLVAAAVVGATGGLTDLRGLGFVVADVWAGAVGHVLAPSPFPNRNLAALLFYGAPLLALAVAGLIGGVRAGDRLAQFLGHWTLLLVALAAAAGPALAFAILPVAPAAVLGGMFLGHLPQGQAAYRLRSGGWTAVALTVLFVPLALLLGTQALGSGRANVVGAQVATLGAAAALVVAVVWRLAAEERRGVMTLLGALAVGVFTVGAIGRTSFGGSPPGAELLAREETHPALRAALRDHAIPASVDPRRALVTEESTPLVVRWYGRDLSMASAADTSSGLAVVIRPAEAPSPSRLAVPRGRGDRTPWKTVSYLDRSDLHPLGLARWAISRTGLVEGQAHDIIVGK